MTTQIVPEDLTLNPLCECSTGPSLLFLLFPRRFDPRGGWLQCFTSIRRDVADNRSIETEGLQQAHAQPGLCSGAARGNERAGGHACTQPTSRSTPVELMVFQAEYTFVACRMHGFSVREQSRDGLTTIAVITSASRLM